MAQIKPAKAKRRGKAAKEAANIEPLRGRGRPEFEPTEEQRQMVLALTGLLVPVEVIARKVINDGKGISEPTLRKYFSAELREGREDTVTNLKATMLSKAQQGSIRALQYLLDRLGGLEFSPRLRLGGMGDDAPPIMVSAEAKITVYIPENGRDRKPADAEATSEPLADPDDPDDGD